MPESGEPTEELTAPTAALPLANGETNADVTRSSGDWNDGIPLLPPDVLSARSKPLLDLAAIRALQSEDMISVPRGAITLSSRFIDSYPAVLELVVPDFVVLTDIDGAEEHRYLAEDATNALLSGLVATYDKASVNSIQKRLEDPNDYVSRNACSKLRRKLMGSSPFSKETADLTKLEGISGGSYEKDLEPSWVTAAHKLRVSTRGLTRWEEALSAESSHSDPTIKSMRDLFWEPNDGSERSYPLYSQAGPVPECSPDSDNADHVPEIRRAVIKQLRDTKQAGPLTDISLEENRWSVDVGSDGRPVLTILLSGRYRTKQSEQSGEGPLKQLNLADCGLLAESLILAFHNETETDLERSTIPEEFDNWTKNLENKSLYVLSALPPDKQIELYCGTHTAKRVGFSGPSALRIVMDASTIESLHKTTKAENSGSVAGIVNAALPFLLMTADKAEEQQLNFTKTPAKDGPTRFCSESMKAFDLVEKRVWRDRYAKYPLKRDSRIYKESLRLETVHSSILQMSVKQETEQTEPFPNFLVHPAEAVVVKIEKTEPTDSSAVTAPASNSNSRRASLNPPTADGDENEADGKDWEDRFKYLLSLSATRLREQLADVMIKREDGTEVGLDVKLERNVDTSVDDPVTLTDGLEGTLMMCTSALDPNISLWTVLKLNAKEVDSVIEKTLNSVRSSGAGGVFWRIPGRRMRQIQGSSSRSHSRRPSGGSRSPIGRQSPSHGRSRSRSRGHSDSTLTPADERVRDQLIWQTIFNSINEVLSARPGNRTVLEGDEIDGWVNKVYSNISSGFGLYDRSLATLQPATLQPGPAEQ